MLYKLTVNPTDNEAYKYETYRAAVKIVRAPNEIAAREIANSTAWSKIWTSGQVSCEIIIPDGESGMIVNADKMPVSSIIPPCVKPHDEEMLEWFKTNPMPKDGVYDHNSQSVRYSMIFPFMFKVSGKGFNTIRFSWNAFWFCVLLTQGYLLFMGCCPMHVVRASLPSKIKQTLDNNFSGFYFEAPWRMWIFNRLIFPLKKR